MKNKRCWLSWLAASCLWVSGCATTTPEISADDKKAQAEQELALLEQQKAAVIKEAPAAQDEAIRSLTSERVIQPGDTLNLEVWLKDRISQLSGFPLKMTVPDSGDMFLPHIGAVQVAGRTYDEVKKDLQGQLNQILTDSYLVMRIERDRARGGTGGRGADVAIGDHIIILGWVGNPGVYPLNPGVRIRDAIAMAGGFKHYAHMNVYLVRGDSDNPVVQRIDVKKILRGEDLSQNVVLAAKDAVYVAPLKMWEISDFISTLLLPIVSIRDTVFLYDRLTED